jgi:hypothetical protein
MLIDYRIGTPQSHENGLRRKSEKDPTVDDQTEKLALTDLVPRSVRTKGKEFQLKKGYQPNPKDLKGDEISRVTCELIELLNI